MKQRIKHTFESPAMMRCFGKVVGMVVVLFTCMSMPAYSQVFDVPPLAAHCNDYTQTSTGCSQCGDGVTNPTSMCIAYGATIRTRHYTDFANIRMVRGQWIAGCGRDPVSGQHRMNYRPLTGLVTVSAEMVYNLAGNPVSPGTVRLVGDIIADAPTTNAALETSFRDRINDSYIWACDSPPAFLQSSGGNIPNTATGRGTGELGNPHCPPSCAYTATPPVRKYRVAFRRADCTPPNNPNRDCDIPEGHYSVTFLNNGLNGRLAPANPPAVMRVDGSFSGTSLPRGTAEGLPPPHGVGYEYWALNDFTNIPPPPPPVITYMCGGTCPDTPNPAPVWPFVDGEEVHANARDVSPEMFMVASFGAEEKRVGTTPVIAPLYASATPYPLFVGPDAGYDPSPNPVPCTFPSPHSNCQNRFPGAITTGNPLAMSSPSKTAPWNDPEYPYPGTTNLMRVTALNVPRRVSDNSIPRNIPLAANQLTNVLNVLRAGYAPWNITSGMSGNQCALLKAGAEMLNNSPNNVNRRKNLIYVGGCPSNWGANTKYAGQDVNWHAFSNRFNGGAPGETNPADLKLRAINTDRTINLTTATEGCFTDVATQVDSLFVMTSNNCPNLAATATAAVANSSSCAGSCRLGTGAGADNASDCAARLLYCLTGASREVTKN